MMNNAHEDEANATRSEGLPSFSSARNLHLGMMNNIDEDNGINMNESASACSPSGDWNHHLEEEYQISSSDDSGSDVNEALNRETTCKENTDTPQPNLETEVIVPPEVSLEDIPFRYATNRYQSEIERRRTANGVLSSVWHTLAPCLSCGIGMHAVCRIALMTALYGGVFVFQFILLSTFIGIPFLVFMVLFGQRVGSGLIQMWFISPGLKGIGIMLQVSCIIFLSYTSIDIIWILPYLVDSMISKNENYRWLNSTSCNGFENHTNLDWILVNKDLETYYNKEIAHFGIGEKQTDVLVRHWTPHIISWVFMAFIASKGITTSFLAVSFTYLIGCVLFFAVCIQLLSTSSGTFAALIDINWFSNLTQSHIWIQSAREVFFTWMMLGGIILHICSHNKKSTKLQRYLITLVFWSTVMLYFAVAFGAVLKHSLEQYSIDLLSISFVDPPVTDIFQIFTLSTNGTTTDDSHVSAVSLHQLKEFSVANQLMGDSFINEETGLYSFKFLRTATQFLPAILSMDCTHFISVTLTLFYISFILTQFSQQLTIFMCFVDVLIQIRLIPKIPIVVVCGVIAIIEALSGLMFSSKIGFYILGTIDATFSSAWGFLIPLSFIGLPMCIENQQLTFKSIVKPVLKNTCGLLFLMLKYFSSHVLPTEIMVLALILFTDPQLSCIYSFSSDKNTQQILAGVFQCIPVLFTVVYAITKMNLNYRKYGNMIESFLNTFAPELSWHVRHRSSMEASALGSEADVPPRYSPPPSYSVATSGQLISRMLRSRSLGEPNIPNANSERTMARRNVNEWSMMRQFLHSRHENVPVNQFNVLETSV